MNVVRKIENIYTYMDYRVLLNDDFMARSHAKPNYSLRAYSRDLGLSVGFLSDILRGHKDLSATKAKSVFEKLGFQADELKYSEKMIDIRGSDAYKKAEALDYIESHYVRPNFHEDPTQDLFLASGEHFIIYGFARRLSDVTKLIQLAERVNISEARTREILAQFQKASYISISEDNQISMKDNQVVIQNHDLVFPRIMQFGAQVANLIDTNGQQKVPEQVAHALILGLDQDSFDLAVEAQKHFIKGLTRISDQSRSVDRFVLLSDYFFTAK